LSLIFPSFRQGGGKGYDRANQETWQRVIESISFHFAPCHLTHRFLLGHVRIILRCRDRLDTDLNYVAKAPAPQGVTAELQLRLGNHMQNPYHPLCREQIATLFAPAFLDPWRHFLFKKSVKSGAGKAQGSVWIDGAFGCVCQALMVVSFDAFDGPRPWRLQVVLAGVPKID
jgi:hypothetical protein